MKRFLIAVFILSLIVSVFAQPQSDRKVDDSGNLIYQYSRSCAKNPAKPSEVLVSFVFINGKNQMAVSYRQEHFNSSVRWVATEGAHQKNEAFVDALTANIVPGDSVVWTFAIEKGVKDKQGTTIEPAAILLMDDTQEVQKVYFEERKFKGGK